MKPSFQTVLNLESETNSHLQIPVKCGLLVGLKCISWTGQQVACPFVVMK